MFDLKNFAIGIINAFMTVIISAIVVLYGLAIYDSYNQDAMKVCQLSHSHDVCFQTLNR